MHLRSYHAWIKRSAGCWSAPPRDGEALRRGMVKRSAKGWWSAPPRDGEALRWGMVKRSAEGWWSAPQRDGEALRQGMVKRSAKGWWSAPQRDEALRRGILKRSIKGCWSAPLSLGGSLVGASWTWHTDTTDVLGYRYASQTMTLHFIYRVII